MKKKTNGPRKTTSDEHSFKLDETISSTKSQTQISKGRGILKNSDPQDPTIKVEEVLEIKKASIAEDKSDVKVAANTLTGAADQMTSALLLALGLLDTNLKWNKATTVAMTLGAFVAVFIAFRTEMSTQNIEKANILLDSATTSIDKTNLELQETKIELSAIRSELKKMEANIAKVAIDQSLQPRVVPGDLPGEIAILTPSVGQEDIEKAKKKVDEALERGDDPPPTPKATKATKIPAKLKPGKMEEYR